MIPVVSITPEETFSSRKNEVAGDGFIFSSKKKKKPLNEQIDEVTILNILNIRQLKNGLFSRDRKPSEPYDCLSLVPREFDGS